MVKSMRKTVSGDYKKRFEKGFKLLCSSKSSYQVWSDCMALFAITLANQSILPMTENLQRNIKRNI